MRTPLRAQIMGSDGKVYNATVTLLADGVTLYLEAQAPAGISAVGTRYGWGVRIFVSVSTREEWIRFGRVAFAASILAPLFLVPACRRGRS